MTSFNCNCSCNRRCSCSIAALAASVIIGILTAFFQITAAITITPVFLWVVFGIAVAYLGILVPAAALTRKTDLCSCSCLTLNTVLIGILGTLLFAVILLAFGITATSIISAILVGLLLFFFSLTFTGLACLIRCLTDCES